jgi:hypothetical protein
MNLRLTLVFNVGQNVRQYHMDTSVLKPWGRLPCGACRHLDYVAMPEAGGCAA